MKFHIYTFVGSWPYGASRWPTSRHETRPAMGHRSPAEDVVPSPGRGDPDGRRVGSGILRLVAHLASRRRRRPSGRSSGLVAPASCRLSWRRPRRQQQTLDIRAQPSQVDQRPDFGASLISTRGTEPRPAGRRQDSPARSARFGAECWVAYPKKQEPASAGGTAPHLAIPLLISSCARSNTQIRRSG